MRKSMTLFLTLLLLLVTAVPAAAESVPLFGVVTDQNGQPVAGAEVEIYGLDAGLVGTLYTGPNGSFTLDSYDGDSLLWQVRVWAKGYRTYDSGWFDLMQQRYQSVRLEKLTGGLQVAVRDEQGLPVEGTATLIGPGGQLEGQFPLVQGQITQENLTVGEYRVLIGSPKLAPGSETLSVLPNRTASAVITMKKAGFTVAGEARDTTSNDPVHDAQVELLRTDLTQIASAATGGDGRFYLAAPNELPGSYLVRVTAPGYRSTTTEPFQVSAGQEHSLSGAQAVQLQALTATLEGEVLDADGDPVEDERVVLLLQGHGEVDREETDDDGTFKFEDLQAGTEYKYTVLPLVDDLIFETEWKALTPGTTEYMALRGEDEDEDADLVSGEGNISGVVTTVGGEPVKGAEVELIWGGDVEETAETNSSGTFLLEDVDATRQNPDDVEDETPADGNTPDPAVTAPYTIRVTADDYFPTRDFLLGGEPEVQLHVTDGSTTSIRVVLRPTEADLQGRVVDGRDGHAISGASVAVVIGDGDSTLRTTTDSNGWYEIDNVPVELAEQYVLRVEAPGYLPLTDLDVTEEATAGSALPTAAMTEDETTFTGQVVGPTGEPQAQVTVTVQGPNGEPLGQGVTDLQGYYQVTTALPRTGQVTLTARKDGWTTATVNLPEAPVAGETVSQTLAILPNTAALEGQLLDEAGMPVSIAWVDLLEEGKGVVASVQPDIVGRFSFRAVDLSDSGWFSLRVRAPGAAFGGSLTHRTELVPMFRLVPGETTVTDLLVKDPAE